MKRTLLGFAGAAALLFAITPQQAQAQNQADLCNGVAIPVGQVCFEYVSNSSVSTVHRYFDASGEFLGPSTWSPLDSPFSIFCVDHGDSPPAPGQVYLAYVTSLTPPLDPGAFDGSYPPVHSGANDWRLYDRAAYLVQSWYSAGMPNDAGSPYNVQDYQFAIWTIMDGSCNFGGTACAEIQPLVNAANAQTDGQLQTLATAGGWSIISDAGSDCIHNSAAARCQEFIYSNTPVPEPGTMSLLALGLSAMAGMGIRKRKRQ